MDQITKMLKDKEDNLLTAKVQYRKDTTGTVTYPNLENKWIDCEELYLFTGNIATIQDLLVKNVHEFRLKFVNRYLMFSEKYSVRLAIYDSKNPSCPIIAEYPSIKLQSFKKDHPIDFTEVHELQRYASALSGVVDVHISDSTYPDDPWPTPTKAAAEVKKQVCDTLNFIRNELYENHMDITKTAAKLADDFLNNVDDGGFLREGVDCL